MWIDWMQEAQGNGSQRQLSVRLGVSQSMVSRVLRGERMPGRKVVTGLLRLLPERAAEIERFFFAQKGDE